VKRTYHVTVGKPCPFGEPALVAAHWNAMAAQLVAVDGADGPGFLDALRRIWDAGDAVLPLDPRAPEPHRDAVVRAMEPSAVVDAGGERHRLDGGRPVQDGDAVCIPTSGTTGTPKGVVLTHAAVEYAAFATATALGVGSDVGWLACLPLSHVAGLGVVTRALHTGARLVVHPTAEGAAIDAAARDGLTHVSLVPTVLRRIDPTLWRVILLGGSAVPPGRPANTVATYGMTESFGGVVYDGLALNGVEVRIAGPPGAPTGEAGPIELRSPTLLRAYRDGTDPVGPNGWYRTGDLGTIGDDGRLRVHGRADDLIITGGENVWPAAVEAVVALDRRVAEVAVVGRADPEWGQRVVAVVVPVDPADPPLLDDLRALTKEHLPVAAAPKDVVLMESLPRTALGKVARTALADERKT
jgi:o-succinylbenzoate---CoA ligase